MHVNGTHGHFLPSFLPLSITRRTARYPNRHEGRRVRETGTSADKGRVNTPIFKRARLAALALAVAIVPLTAGPADAASKHRRAKAKRTATVTVKRVVTKPAAPVATPAPAAAPAPAVTSVISIGGYVFYNLTYAEAVEAYFGRRRRCSRGLHAAPGHLRLGHDHRHRRLIGVPRSGALYFLKYERRDQGRHLVGHRLPVVLHRQAQVRGGVAEFGGEVEVEYHSFELAPDTPVDFDGSELDFLAKHKGMPAAQVKPMLDRVAGDRRGGRARLRLRRAPAHEHRQGAPAAALRQGARQAARDEGAPAAARTSSRAAHVGRAEDLADLAAEVGLDRDDGAPLPRVRRVPRRRPRRPGAGDALRHPAASRSSSIDGKYGVSGAQAPETFAQVLKQVAGRARRGGVVSAFEMLGDPAAAACEGDACALPTPEPQDTSNTIPDREPHLDQQRRDRDRV